MRQVAPFIIMITIVMIATLTMTRVVMVMVMMMSTRMIMLIATTMRGPTFLLNNDKSEGGEDGDG